MQEKNMYFSRNVLIISIVAMALVVGIFVYLWQNTNLKSTELFLNKQIIDLQKQVVKSKEMQVNPDKEVLNNAAFFIREDDNYVLYTMRGDKKEKTGLTVPVQKEPYSQEDQSIAYNDLSLAAVISPNGEKVAYLIKKDPEELGQFSLYISNIDGSNVFLLSSPAGNYGHGAISDKFFWDANSQNIFYADKKVNEGGTTYDVYNVNVNTKEKLKIISDSGSWDPSDASKHRRVEIIPIGYFKD